MNVQMMVAITLLTMCAIPSWAQKKKSKVAVKDSVATVTRGASNMMLNASDESTPRFINVGLPEATGGTLVTENGMDVSLDVNALRTNQVWRQDGSFSRGDSRNLDETAIKYGNVGVSMSTNSKKGGKQFAGAVNIKSNSFGLINGNVLLSGPIKKGWAYAVNAFINMDPGTTNVNFARFLDETQIYKGVLTKRYKQGEFNVQYKYAQSAAINTKMSPYIYHNGSQVEALPNFDIQHGNYLGNSGVFHFKNPLTGQYEDVDLMKDTKSRTHSVDIFGNHRLRNGVNFDYSVRFLTSKAGSNSFAYSAITDSKDLAENQRYIYANTGNLVQEYEGLAQNTTVQYSKDVPMHTLMGRFELNKKNQKHQWSVGLTSSYNNVDKYTSGIVTFMQEVAENPQHIILQTQLEDGSWTNNTYKNGTPDQYGNWAYNASMFYYDGSEYKNALYATDKWKILPNLTLNLGARIEWHKIDGNWAPGTTVRNDANVWPDKTYVSGATEAIKKNFFNKSFTATATWNILKNFGLIADAYYIEVTDGLSSYKTANDPMIRTNKVPYFAGGVFYNSKWISLISRVSKISRSNLVASGGFNHPDGRNQKLSFNYDIETVGWTTDANITPFKGFNLHLMLTLQNPTMQNFEFEVFGEKYNYNGLPARITSKTLIEIDPSYQWKKFRLWGSARYFSKQSCSYPATLFFPSRWETFAGFDYKYNKYINFSISAVNLLNQTGAQGRISGTNTATDPAPYDNKAVAGTYIRPFTLEFKTQIKF